MVEVDLNSIDIIHLTGELQAEIIKIYFTFLKTTYIENKYFLPGRDGIESASDHHQQHNQFLCVVHDGM